MKTATKQPHPDSEHHVHTARKRAAASDTYRVISAADFLRDPKLAVVMVANGTRVCVRGDKTQILIGLPRGKAKTARRVALYRKTVGAKVFAHSKTAKPICVSWMT